MPRENQVEPFYPIIITEKYDVTFSIEGDPMTDDRSWDHAVPVTARAIGSCRSLPTRTTSLAERQKANIIRQRAESSPRTDMSDNGNRGEDGPGTGVVVKATPKAKKPSMYKMHMLNDDYTPMELVVHILERFFDKNRQEATRIMLLVHRRG